MLVKFENVELNVIENNNHEWLLETALVAKGYDTSIDSILKHLQRKKDELIEGKHYLREVDNLSTHPDKVYWSKRGVVRLGFFIRSKNAVKFRDWAEDLVIEKTEQKPLSQLEILVQSAQLLLEQDKRISSVENKVLQLEARTTTRPEYFTVVGYGNLNGITINLNTAAKVGKRASSICKNRNLPMDTIPDPRFGVVRMYPKVVLEEVFALPL